jgi:hypothetical protein
MGGILSKLGDSRLGIASVFYTSLDVRLRVAASGGKAESREREWAICVGFFFVLFFQNPGFKGLMGLGLGLILPKS